MLPQQAQELVSQFERSCRATECCAISRSTGRRLAAGARRSAAPGLPGEYALLAASKIPLPARASPRCSRRRRASRMPARQGRCRRGRDRWLVARYAPAASRPHHGSPWTGSEGQALSDDVTPAVRLLAYHHAPFTEPREAVRRAVAEIGDNMLFRQRTDTTSKSSQSNRGYHRLERTARRRRICRHAPRHGRSSRQSERWPWSKRGQVLVGADMSSGIAGGCRSTEEALRQTQSN